MEWSAQRGCGKAEGMAWRLRFIPKGLDQVPTCDSRHVSPLASVGLLRIGLGSEGVGFAHTSF